MSNYDINDLLEKFKTGRITPDEQAFLETWYLNWQTEPVEISDEEIELAKARVWSSLKQSPFRWKPWYWFSLAAGIFLVTGLLWLFTWRSSISPMQHANLKSSGLDFKPGMSKATLTLDGGEKIDLDRMKVGRLASQGDMIINQEENGKIIYGHSSGKMKSVRMMNKITTPRGGEYKLILADGTKVWLNAGSSITFPVDFTGESRLVSITGEAYFEVFHDKTKPFVVSTADQQITVLGTHFNVSAYADDNFTSTSLISGLVQVKSKISSESTTIHPGQGAITSSGNKEVRVDLIDVDEVLAWKNGYFQFDNQSIYTIMKIMGRWYDVDVEYKGVNNQERFGGTFSRGKNLSESLVNLEKIGKVRFKLTPGKIIVTD